MNFQEELQTEDELSRQFVEKAGHAPAVALEDPLEVGNIFSLMAEEDRRARTIEPGRTGKIGALEELQRMDWSEMAPYAGTAEEAFKTVALARAMNRAEQGKGTLHDDTLIENYMSVLEEEERRGGTWGRKVAQIAVGMPRFMGEMAGTGKIATAGAEKLGLHAAKKAIARYVKKRLLRKGLQAGAQLAARATVRAAVVPQMAVERAAQRQIRGRLRRTEDGNIIVSAPQEGAVKSAVMGYVGAATEFGTEESGRYLTKGVGMLAGKAGRVAGKVMPGTAKALQRGRRQLLVGLHGAWKRLNPNKGVREFIEHLYAESGKSLDPREEWYEEHAGAVLHALTGAEDFGTGARGYSAKDVLRRLEAACVERMDPAQALAELTAFSILPAGQVAAQMGASAIDRARGGPAADLRLPKPVVPVDLTGKATPLDAEIIPREPSSPTERRPALELPEPFVAPETVEPAPMPEETTAEDKALLDAWIAQERGAEAPAAPPAEEMPAPEAAPPLPAEVPAEILPPAVPEPVSAAEAARGTLPLWSPEEEAQRAALPELPGPAEPLAEALPEAEPETPAETFTDRDTAFQRMADVQRSESSAETLGTFSNKHEPLTTGLYGNSLEHIGDLTHRLGEKFSFFKGQYAIPKILAQFRDLTNNYGYERDVREQIQSGIKSSKLDVPLAEGVSRVKKHGQKYADAHRNVPVFNELQWRAREAAIALGEWRFADAANELRTLQGWVDDGSFTARAGEIAQNAENRIVPFAGPALPAIPPVSAAEAVPVAEPAPEPVSAPAAVSEPPKAIEAKRRVEPEAPAEWPIKIVGQGKEVEPLARNALGYVQQNIPEVPIGEVQVGGRGSVSDAGIPGFKAGFGDRHYGSSVEQTESAMMLLPIAQERVLKGLVQQTGIPPEHLGFLYELFHEAAHTSGIKHEGRASAQAVKWLQAYLNFRKTKPLPPAAAPVEAAEEPPAAVKPPPAKERLRVLTRDALRKKSVEELRVIVKFRRVALPRPPLKPNLIDAILAAQEKPAEAPAKAKVTETPEGPVVAPAPAVEAQAAMPAEAKALEEVEEGEEYVPTKEEQAEAAESADAASGDFLRNVSAEKQAEAARLIEKLRKKFNTVGVGVDPTIMTDGIQLTAIYVEAGARNFAEYARMMYDTFGDKAKAYMRSWWNQVADQAEYREQISDLSREDADTVLASLGKEEAVPPAPATEVEAEPDLSPQIAAILDSGSPPAAKAVRFRTLALEREISEKEIQELTEVELVKRARAIADPGEGKPQEAALASLVELYNSQPSLRARDSVSMTKQKYSTPIPLAYMLGRAIGVQRGTIYEPTAGHGALLIAAPDLSKVHANEMDADRLARLRKQGYGLVTANDASEYTPKAKSFDHVIANPPFGGLGKKRVGYENYAITQLDHLIALRALEAMQDDGTAGLIIGGNMKMGTHVGTGAKGIFLNYLYNHFDFVHVFQAEGKLYAKQGASFPVWVITLAGRKAEALTGKSAPLTVENAETWEQVVANLKEAENGIAAWRNDVGARRQRKPGPRPPDRPSEESRRPAKLGGRAALAHDDAAEGAGRGEPGGAGRVHGLSEQDAVPGVERPTRRRRRPGIRVVPPELPEPPGKLPSGRLAGVAGQLLPDPGTVPGRGVGPAGTRSQLPKPDRPPARDIVEHLGPEGTRFFRTYHPFSEGPRMDTVVPSNMAEGTFTALSRVETQTGMHVDEYIRRELGYESIAAMHNGPSGSVDEIDGLGAEQVDGIAMILHQVKAGSGVILGDQAGVGKGRQIAAVMYWARKQGWFPVFVTESPKLFSDMYADTADIGASIKAHLIGNKGKATVRDQANKTLQAALSPPAQRALEKEWMAGRRKLADDCNAIFFTYSQGQKIDNAQQAFLDWLVSSRDAVVIFDEAHKAAGDKSNIGFYLRGGETVQGKGAERRFVNFPGLLNAPGVKGVLYSSATYGKRADCMALYVKTALGDAAGPGGDLLKIMTLGGEPLLELVSQALTAKGQLIRRDRSFSGEPPALVEATGKTTKEAIVRNIDSVTRVLNRIIAYSHQFREWVLNSPPVIAARATSTADRTSVTSFSSVVHNNVSQLLLAMKTDVVAEEAIKAFRKGEKPIIVLENTMGALLDTYILDEDLKPGDVFDLNFAKTLKTALDRTMRVSVKSAEGNPEILQFTPDECGLAEPYRRIADIIEGLHLAMPASPIDRIRYRLEKAGIKTSEITGRTNYVDYRDDGKVVLRRRSQTAKNKNVIVNDFNAGKLQSLIMNEAGSTGLSLHASKRFPDKKPRHMFVVQPPLNINTFIQTLRRIQRSGMVEGGARYSILTLPIAAELRPATVLNSKLRQLQASISAKVEGEIRLVSEDIFSRCGDRIAATLLEEDYSLAQSLNLENMCSLDPEGELNVKAAAELAQKFFGRMALLPNRRQESLAARFKSRLDDHVQYLKDIGEYDLEIVSHDDWNAKVLEETILTEGTDETDMFAASLVLKTLETLDTRKPPKWPDVVAAAKAGGIWEHNDSEALLTKTLADLASAEATYLADEPADSDPKTHERIQWERRQHTVEAAKEGLLPRFRYVFGRIGRAVSVSVGPEDNRQVYTGFITRFDVSKSAQPYSPHRFHLTIHVPAGIGKLKIPFSKLLSGEASLQAAHESGESVFENKYYTGKQQKTVMTGNLLRGLESARKGKLIRFKYADGRQENALLLPASWKPDAMEHDPRKDFTSGAAFIAYAETFSKRGQVCVATPNDLTIVSFSYAGHPLHSLVSTAARGTKGDRYFKDAGLTDITGTLTKRGERMYSGELEPADTAKLVDYLRDKKNELVAIDWENFEAVKAANAGRKVPLPDYRIPSPEEATGNLGTAFPDEVLKRIGVLTDLISGAPVETAAALTGLIDGKQRKAWGRWLDGTVTIAGDQSETEAIRTALHENWHAVEDLFLSPAEIIACAQAIPDPEARADAFMRYAEARSAGKGTIPAQKAAGKGIVAKVRALFERIYRALKSLFAGKPKGIDLLHNCFDKALAGEYPGRVRPVSAVSGIVPRTDVPAEFAQSQADALNLAVQCRPAEKPSPFDAEDMKYAEGQAMGARTWAWTKESANKTLQAIDNAVGVLSVQFERISPELFRRTRELQAHIDIRAADYMREVFHPFVAAMRSMSSEDRRFMEKARAEGNAKKIGFLIRKYDHPTRLRKRMGLENRRAYDNALKAGNKKEAARIRSRYAFGRNFEHHRKMMGEFRVRLSSVGIDIHGLPVYHPRSVRDYVGLVTYLKGTPAWTYIQNEIDRTNEGLGPDNLSTQEEAVVANEMLQGTRPGLPAAAASHFKSRRLKSLDAEMMTFYYPMDISLAWYIRSMNRLIAFREFFGKADAQTNAAMQKLLRTAKKIGKADKQIARLNERLEENPDMEEELRARLELRIAGLLAQISALREVRSETKKVLRIEGDGNPEVLRNIESSIGDVVNRLGKAGVIKAKDEARVRSLIAAYWDDSGIQNKVLSVYRDVVLIGAIGQFSTAITQTADNTWTCFYSGAWHSMPSLGRALARQSRIKLDHITPDIMPEFSHSRKSAWLLGGILRAAGTQYLDSVARETLANAADLKLRTDIQAMCRGDKKAEKRVREKMTLVFGDEFYEMLADLLEGDPDNFTVRRYAHFMISEYQPMSRLETPMAYRGNVRLLYTIKTYQIKQINNFRVLIMRGLRRAAKNKDWASVARLLKELSAMTIFLALFEGFQDVLKDFIFGREIDLKRTGVDVLGQVAGLSRWDVYNFRREGMTGAVLNRLFPRAKLVEFAIKDYMHPDTRGLRSLGLFPVVGKFYYEHWGRRAAIKRGERNRYRRQNDPGGVTAPHLASVNFEKRNKPPGLPKPPGMP